MKILLTELYLSASPEMVTNGIFRHTVVLSTKDSMDADKLITVGNLPILR